MYHKVKRLLDFVDNEIKKPLENHNPEARMWSKGYRKAMIIVREFIWIVFNKE